MNYSISNVYELTEWLEKEIGFDTLLIDGGFTPVSVDEEELRLEFGKRDNAEECQRSKVSHAELLTFLDMHAMYEITKSRRDKYVVPVLTLSDMHWNRQSRHGSPRSLITNLLDHRKNDFIPKEYKISKISSDSQFLDRILVVLQHQFSSILQHQIRNHYSYIKKAKNINTKLHRHKSVYDKTGWIYLMGTDSHNDRYGYLSTKSMRSLENHKNSVISKTLWEQAIAINHKVAGGLPTQLCGATSASRFLFFSDLANKLRNNFAGRVVSVHFFDKSDDHHIDKKLTRGMFVSNPLESENHLHIAVIKENGEIINIIELSNIKQLTCRNQFESDVYFEIIVEELVFSLKAAGKFDDVRLAYT